MKKLLLIFISIPSLIVRTPVYAQDPGHSYWTGPWMMNWGFGTCWIIPLVMMIAFWIAVIAGVVFFVRWLMSLTGKGHDMKSEETPLDILKKRYARGEISKEDFERMKKDIS